MKYFFVSYVCMVLLNIHAVFAHDFGQNFALSDSSNDGWKRFVNVMKNRKPAFKGKGERCFSISYGLISNIYEKERGTFSKRQVPPIAIQLEKGFAKNWGYAVYAGFSQWQEKEMVDFRYRYWTFGHKINYHIRIVPKIDFYLGASSTFRMVIMNYDCWHTQRFRLSFNLPIGLRYQFLPNGGLLAEIGSDMNTKYKLGLYYRF